MGKIKNSLVSLVVGAGLVFGAGAVDVARGGEKSVFSKSYTEMTHQEKVFHDWAKSQNTYNRVPEKERGESLQDYQLRGGDTLNPKGPKRKDDFKNNSQSQQQNNQGALEDGVGNGLGVYHIVEKGETLFDIGLRYKIPWKDLKKINNLESNQLYIGQKLNIMP